MTSLFYLIFICFLLILKFVKIYYLASKILLFFWLDLFKQIYLFYSDININYRDVKGSEEA